MSHQFTAAQLAPSKEPTASEIAWAAGIFEGEGTCGAGSGTLIVHISQKKPEILRKLRALFGGRVTLIRARQCTEFNGYVWKKTLWHWNITGAKARIFMAAISPWLSRKRLAQYKKARKGFYL